MSKCVPHAHVAEETSSRNESIRRRRGHGTQKSREDPVRPISPDIIPHTAVAIAIVPCDCQRRPHAHHMTIPVITSPILTTMLKLKFPSTAGSTRTISKIYLLVPLSSSSSANTRPGGGRNEK